jgi:hypothetical protein
VLLAPSLHSLEHPRILPSHDIPPPIICLPALLISRRSHYICELRRGSDIATLDLIFPSARLTGDHNEAVLHLISRLSLKIFTNNWNLCSSSTNLHCEANQGPINYYFMAKLQHDVLWTIEHCFKDEQRARLRYGRPAQCD